MAYEQIAQKMVEGFNKEVAFKPEATTYVLGVIEPSVGEFVAREFAELEADWFESARQDVEEHAKECAPDFAQLLAWLDALDVSRGVQVEAVADALSSFFQVAQLYPPLPPLTDADAAEAE